MLFYSEESLKNYIHSNTKALIEEHGLLEKDGSGRGYICPICKSGSGPKGTGLTYSEETGGFTCWHPGVCFGKAHPSGGCYGDLIDIVAAERGITDYREKIKYFCRRCNFILEAEADSRSLDWDDVIGNGDEEIYPVEVKEKSQKEQEIPKEITHFQTDDDKVKRALSAIEKTLNDESGQYSAFFEEAKSKVRNPECLKALSERGISETNPLLDEVGFTESLNLFPIRQRPCFIFPTSNEGYIARDIDPRASQKEKTAKPKDDWKNGKPAPDIPAFLIKAIKERDKKLKGTQLPEPIFIVEGPMDALSIAEVGGDAISLNGLGGIDLIIAAFRKYQIERPVILLLDNDDAGIEAQEKHYKALKEAGFEVESVKLFSDKDANECLLNDPETLLWGVYDIKQKAIEEFEESFNRAQKKLFEEYLKDYDRNKPIKTGFRGLDNARFLDGGLRAGLYIIGAISSLGKTTFTLEIADQIATLGNDVIFFSLEMDKYEIMGKSVSRYTLKHLYDAGKFKVMQKPPVEAKNFHRIHRDYQKDEDKTISTAIWEYFNDTGDHLRIVEGNSKKYGDIDADTVEQIVKQHIQITGRRPVIFIDYLQLLKAPKEDGKRFNKTDKQIVDENVFKLKQISRDYHIPVFGISSFNRDNYYEPVSMKSFKESGAIEYSSDCLIGLEYEYMNLSTSSKQEREAFKAIVKQHKETFEEKGYKTIRLKMLKNRNGYAGNSELFYYYPAYNCFFEKIEVPDFKDIPV